MGLFFQNKSYEKTELVGEEYDSKVNIIEHVHLEHRDELGYVLACFTDVQAHDSLLPVIDDIYADGVSIGYLPKHLSVSALSVSEIMTHPYYQTQFVPFRIKNATLDEKFYYLNYEAAIKLDKPLGKNTLRYFEVLKTSRITNNMQRIHFSTDMALPENTTGLAFSFAMTTMSRQALQQKQKQNSASENDVTEPSSIKQQASTLAKTVADKVGKQAYKVMFEVFKRLPQKQRDRVAKQTGKTQSRYYTLRKLVDAPNAANTKPSYQGYVDVFIHGDTVGGNWATGLTQGDIFYSQRDYEEKTAHLNTGQALLLCDETSMPTAAACLENWNNPIAPMVICITHHESEHTYLSDIALPALLDGTLNIVYLCYDESISAEETSERIITMIDEQDKKIDAAWGALEVKTAKKIKKYLRETHQLPAKNNHVKGYWKYNDD